VGIKQPVKIGTHLINKEPDMSKSLPKKKKETASIAAEVVLENLEQLVLLSNVFEDEVGQSFHKFLKSMEKEESAQNCLKRYGKLWKGLVDFQTHAPHSASGNLLQDYFLERLLENDNAFHRQAEQKPFENIGSSLKMAYGQELEMVQRALRMNWEGELQKKLGSKNTGAILSLDAHEHSKAGDGFGMAKARKRFKEKLLNGKGISFLNEIADHFYKNGWGLFGRYRAFRWEVARSGEGRLEGIDNVDPIILKNLIGYDEARKALLESIEGFVAGKGGNNVLIYGERGTGKSSTVKALLNAYHDKGLRLVEVMASHLDEYHDILRHLKGRKEKFILFVDDLSFEENETSYKGLKALLEGAIEATPSNVILIATSNRRHLIREFFDDRAGSIQKEGEIHGADTIEEKLSLSDRFGLVISFLSPNQDVYLKIVENWAKVEGIHLPAEELRLKSLQWSRFNNGRSGRTARQFINDLKGKV
jgi:predicted AAA+ superfamily ATPase